MTSPSTPLFLFIAVQLFLHICLNHFIQWLQYHFSHLKTLIDQEWLDKIDDQYLKHWLQRDPVTKDEVIMELYQEIVLQWVFAMSHHSFDMMSQQEPTDDSF